MIFAVRCGALRCAPLARGVLAFGGMAVPQCDSAPGVLVSPFGLDVLSMEVASAFSVRLVLDPDAVGCLDRFDHAARASPSPSLDRFRHTLAHYFGDVASSA